MDKEIKDENFNNNSDIPEEDHGLTADKIAHLLEHLGDEVIRDMLDSAGLDYDDPFGENVPNKDDVEDDKDEEPEEEYVGKRFRREPEEAVEESEEADEKAVEIVDETDAPVESAADVDTPEIVESNEAVENDESSEVAVVGSEETESIKEVSSEEAPEEDSDETDSAAEADRVSESSKESTDDGSENSEEKDETGSAAAETDPEENPADEVSKPKDKKSRKDPSRKKRQRKVPLIRRLLFVFVLIGILLLPVAIHFIYISATLNSDDPIQYSKHVDEVSCTDGVLKVNNVEASVPTDGTEEYSISYSWSEEDEQYPSVPHAITAVYKGGEGERKYSISLYRNETIPAAEIKEGRNADNWFDEWEASEDDETMQAPLQFENIKGFYISPKANPDDPDAPPEYSNYSFYFAVQDSNGVSIYVLEGDCTDDKYSKDFADIMETSIKSITIKMPDSEQS